MLGSILSVTKDQLDFKKKSYSSGACIVAAIAVSTVVLPSVVSADQADGYVLFNVATKRCLDSNNRGGWYGDAYTRDCNGGDFQKWRIYSEGDHSLMQNSASSFFLGDHRDIFGRHYVDVFTRSWDSESHYGHWLLIPFGINSWNIMNTHRGECLDSDSVGGVYLRTCNYYDNSQKWQLASVSVPAFPAVLPPPGVIGWFYELNLKAHAEPAITNYAISFGELPPGIELDSKSGVLVGTPTQLGTWKAEVTASNGLGKGNRSVTITVMGPPPKHFDIQLVNMSSLQIDSIECKVEEPLFEKCLNAATYLDPGEDTLSSFELLNRASLTFRDSNDQSVILNINPQSNPAVTIVSEPPNVHVQQGRDRSTWKVTIK